MKPAEPKIYNISPKSHDTYSVGNVLQNDTFLRGVNKYGPIIFNRRRTKKFYLYHSKRFKNYF